MLGYQSILCGQSNIVISGGQESMSQSHHSMHMRSGFKMGDACLVDTMLKDGLTDAFNNEHMGKTGTCKTCNNNTSNLRKFTINSINRDCILPLFFFVCIKFNINLKSLFNNL